MIPSIPPFPPLPPIPTLPPIPPLPPPLPPPPAMELPPMPTFSPNVTEDDIFAAAFIVGDFPSVSWDDAIKLALRRVRELGFDTISYVSVNTYWQQIHLDLHDQGVDFDDLSAVRRRAENDQKRLTV